MIKQVIIAAVLVTGAAGGALAQTRTIHVWGAQLEVPAYGAAAPAVTSGMTAASRFDRDNTTFTSMTARSPRSQHHSR